MKDLYNENWKILMKQIKEDNKWKDIFCSWIGKIDILPEVTYSQQNIKGNFYGNRRNNSKICGEPQKLKREGQGSLACCSPWGHKDSDTPQWTAATQKLNKATKGYKTAEAFLREKSKAGDIMLPDFELC